MFVLQNALGKGALYCIIDAFNQQEIVVIELTQPWRYNIGGGGITVSPFTCQVKSTFKENRALTPNVPPYFNQSSRIDDRVVQLQLKIVNNYT